MLCQCCLLLQSLQKAITEHISDVEYINKTGEELVSRSNDSEDLKSQLASLNKRWNSVSLSIANKLSQLATGIEKLREFEVSDEQPVLSG